MSKRAVFANIVLGIITLLFLFLFVYTISGNNVHPPGHMSKYYIFLSAGFFFFAYVLFRGNAEWKDKIALLALTLTIGIYVFEVFLSYNQGAGGTMKTRADIADYWGVPFDSRFKFEVVRDVLKKGGEVYPFYSPYESIEREWKEILPLGFISGKTILQCNESGVWLTYKSDEYGFENPEGIYDQKSIDYVLIGDSMTQGFCVNREENIAGRLISGGNKVLNLGMGNTGPLIQLGILKEYAKPVKSRYVLWFFYEGNDHEGLEFDKTSPILMKYLNKDFSQNLADKQKLIDGILIKHAEREFNFAQKNMKLRAEKKEETNNKKQESFSNILLSSLKLPQLRNRLNRLSMIGECEYKVDPLLKDIFKEAKDTVNGQGGKLVFVYLPSVARYTKQYNYCRKRYLNSGKKEVLSVMKELQIPIIDIQPVLDSYPDPLSLLPFRIFGHYNAKGYKIIAENIELNLAKNMGDPE